MGMRGLITAGTCGENLIHREWPVSPRRFFWIRDCAVSVVAHVSRELEIPWNQRLRLFCLLWTKRSELGNLKFV
jgi:hypothetical protein